MKIKTVRTSQRPSTRENYLKKKKISKTAKLAKHRAVNLRPDDVLYGHVPCKLKPAVSRQLKSAISTGYL